MLLDQLDQARIYGGKVVTTIEPGQTFYPAEAYHQDYLRKNPGGYTCHYLRD